MKSIAIIAHSLLGGGVEKVVLSLAKGFTSERYKVCIILLKDHISYNLPEDLIVYKLKKYKMFKKLNYSIQIKNILKNNNIDLLISNFTDFSGMKIVDLVNFKNTYTIVHNTQSKRRFKRHDSKKNTFLKTIKKKKVENSFYNKNLICVSNGVKNDLIDNFEIKPKSIDTIYNPFDVNDIQIMADINNPVIPNEDYIIHVGRFEIGHKRHDILLKAYKKSNIKEKLVLLGDGKDRSTIEDLIKELNLEDKVILAGFDSNPYPWIKNAKLFLFSSDYEGFGMVLVESLILNTPVVSTDCPSGPSEILTGELANYLVPVGDIDALASKMKNALEYYPQIKDEYINKFNSYTIIEQYINLINN